MPDPHPERCETCRFRVPGSKRVYDNLLNTDEAYDYCHRHAPRITDAEDVVRWPWVRPNDWCGEWKEGPPHA